MQRDVAYFNQAIKTPRGDTPEMRAAELRARLILEEAFETVEAMVGVDRACELIDEAVVKQDVIRIDQCDEPDMVEAVDGLCDLLYVTFGAFDAFGIDAESFFQIVHEANMTKLGGPQDANGKQLKPTGFVPPQERIRELLVKMGWSGK